MALVLSLSLLSKDIRLVHILYLIVNILLIQRFTDIRKGLGVDLNFKLGRPFRPFEQLMGVLPDRSKSIVPKPYWV